MFICLFIGHSVPHISCLPLSPIIGGEKLISHKTPKRFRQDQYVKHKKVKIKIKQMMS